jgi:hypothetical protein
MIPGHPEIAQPRDWRSGWRELIDRFVDRRSVTDEEFVDLGDFEARDREIEVKIDGRKIREQGAEEFAVPRGMLGQAIVEQEERFLFLGRQMREGDRWHFRDAEANGSGKASVTTNDAGLLID